MREFCHTAGKTAENLVAIMMVAIVVVLIANSCKDNGGGNPIDPDQLPSDTTQNPVDTTQNPVDTTQNPVDTIQNNSVVGKWKFVKLVTWTSTWIPDTATVKDAVDYSNYNTIYNFLKNGKLIISNFIPTNIPTDIEKSDEYDYEWYYIPWGKNENSSGSYLGYDLLIGNKTFCCHTDLFMKKDIVDTMYVYGVGFYNADSTTFTEYWKLFVRVK